MNRRRHPSLIYLGSVARILPVLALLHGAAARCAAAEDAVSFERDIAPLLSTHCAECHGPNVQKGHVSLRSREEALGAGEWRAVVVPGRPEASKLLEAVSGPEPEMPKKGARLTGAEVALLRKWIATGADWPTHVALKEKVQGAESLWSLRPVVTEPPPRVPGANSSMDAFVQARLDADGLRPVPEADRRTLIRRLSFTLRGLPPTPEEVSAFLADAHPQAWERLVDRFLASPHYGERWARHWLDIAHYADTHGFERDQKRDRAWPYRDWVIRALNDDMPYDRFLREQIAGDVLAPQDANAVIATGFLAAGPWDFVGQKETPSPVLKRQARADELDDMATQVITATMGLTLNCARCHNHKLDPISQEDYYRITAAFAGVTRGEREIDPAFTGVMHASRESWRARLAVVQNELARLAGPSLDLADIVGGEDGRGTGSAGGGIDPGTGKRPPKKQAFLTGAAPNIFRAMAGTPGSAVKRYIDGVTIPDGSHPVVISSTGLAVSDLPRTSGKAWDAIRSGPVNAQARTVIDGTDYARPGHSLLALHANAAITFDLQAMRPVLGQGAMRFTAMLGFGGSAPNARADFHLYADGRRVLQRIKFGANDAGLRVDVLPPLETRFLTLVSTDGGDGISHDQVFLGDPKVSLDAPEQHRAEHRALLARLRAEQEELNRKLAALPKPEKFYGVVSSSPPPVHVLTRGNPEAPAALVQPGPLSCWPGRWMERAGELPDEGTRRRQLAAWITDPSNPLTARVMVNRLWHHHFGRGLVDTPSDFGQGGGKPSHAALLDWLAREFMRSGWSLKHLHRLILTSDVYRRSSLPRKDDDTATRKDAANVLLSRMNPRRLDAESLRDAVLATSGSLNAAMGGPGYQDFTYQEAYAPIYTHIPADRPELWRRSIYRFIVRTTPQRFMTTMDCPDPANLTPARLTTTTALQSLALMNNAFMLGQAERFAARVRREAGPSAKAQVIRAFALAFQRAPAAEELREAQALVDAQGLESLCRLLFNANEFVHLD